MFPGIKFNEGFNRNTIATKKITTDTYTNYLKERE